MVKPIVTVPNTVLDKKTEKIKKFKSAETKQLVKNLRDTLEVASEPEGAGLSANQIGVSKSVCLVRNFFLDPLEPEKELFVEHVLINPKIVFMSKEEEVGWEGCLSIPNTYGKVPRAHSIKVSYRDETGAHKNLTAEGFFARVIQHEVDHLNGILFTTKVEGKTVPESYFD